MRGQRHHADSNEHQEKAGLLDDCADGIHVDAMWFGCVHRGHVAHSAHSLYKAHEFLSSGSVMARRAATQTAPIAPQPVPLFVILLTMAGLTTVAWGMLLAVGQDPSNKPGGWLLTAILCAALNHLAGSNDGRSASSIGSASLVDGACLNRDLCHQFLADRQPCFTVCDIRNARVACSVGVAVAFAGLFAFQIALMSPRAAYQLRNWQITRPMASISRVGCAATCGRLSISLCFLERPGHPHNYLHSLNQYRD